jgi:hypothetical protein
MSLHPACSFFFDIPMLKINKRMCARSYDSDHSQRHTPKSITDGIMVKTRQEESNAPTTRNHGTPDLGFEINDPLLPERFTEARVDDGTRAVVAAVHKTG